MDDENDIQWIAAVERNHSPLFIDLFLKGQRKSNDSDTPPLNIRFEHIKKERLAVSVDGNELKQNHVVARETNPEILEALHSFARECELSSDNLIEKSQLIGGRRVASTSELHNALETFCAGCLDHMRFLLPILTAQRILEEELRAMFQTLQERGFNEQQISEAQLQVQFTTREVAEPANVFDILTLASDAKSNPEVATEIRQNPNAVTAARLASRWPDFWQKIQHFKEKYKWMGQTYFLGEPTEEVEIIGRIRLALNKDSDRELARIEAAKESQIKRRDEILKNFVNPNQARRAARIIELFDWFVFLRSRRLDAFFIAFGYCSWIVDSLAKHYGFIAEDLVYLTECELGSLKATASPRTLGQLIRRRRSGYGALMIGDSIRWYFPEQSSSEAQIKATTQITGVTANPGTASGKVKIVLSTTDVSKVEEGDILVTTMTLPNLLVAVERAGAIVTDEGGLLCHAAIISRELNIPCIIGTRLGTKVLVDGENVLVNATEGVVVRQSSHS